MSDRADQTKVHWWEYPWYLLVSTFLLLVGLVLFAVNLLVRAFGSMKRIKIYLIELLVIAAATVAGAGYAYYHRVDLGDRVVPIIIESGASFESVANELLVAGVVESRLTLKLAARWFGIDRKLTPGRYDFTGENSCRSVLKKFREADFVRIKVTVPEGATLWQVAAILAEKLDHDSAKVMSVVQDTIFLTKMGLPCFEGYLFPETYFFPWGTRAEDAVEEMVVMHRSMTDSIWPEHLPMDLSRDEIVRLASIIEAETGLDSERVIVASVYTNRLRANMKLDADPTVVYGLGGLDRPLYRKDLERDTPYNTYLKKGLPPTAINSPGLASIRAALSPRETEYLYFVADNKGGHRFSRTNAEHNRARREIQAAQGND